MSVKPFSRFLASKWGIVIIGSVIGIIASILQKLGNPPNMGICVACFQRDIAGALGLHRASVVQYIRPEILGFVLGSMVAAFIFREFKARTGSAPIVRFVLGIFAMIGALTFLGCPWRALLRLAGGDLNAIVGLIGLTIGITIGDQFLKYGYNLGRSYKTYFSAGLIMPVIMAGLLFLAIFSPKFTTNGAIFFSTKGPGALHAPLIISLGASLIIGFLSQRTRFCTMGSIRDVLLIGDPHFIRGIIALIISAFLVNLMLGQVNFGITAQPIAHSNHLWNLLGMVLAGLAFVLAGGCPGRQLVLSGEGDGDASVFVLGMVTGAAFAHNFGLAAKPDKILNGVVYVGGVSSAGMAAVIIGILVCVIIGFTMREKI
ncbi:MAG: YedE-related selenium metabolism membrane protein [Desulfobacteraceae bacterium 4572_130]|nr:MAG: YedE-related selenium metabolism membrane protein [Desulfobacteraceae bacterium 4572_130]